MAAADCCGQRMQWSVTRDEVECGSCNRTVSGEALHAARSRITRVSGATAGTVTCAPVVAVATTNSRTTFGYSIGIGSVRMGGTGTGLAIGGVAGGVTTAVGQYSPPGKPLVVTCVPDEACACRAAGLPPCGDCIRAVLRLPTATPSGAMPREPERATPVDPLAVEYDGVTLRYLLLQDAMRRKESATGISFTPAQRAAVSAHWSAELRAKVATTKQADAERERCRVTITHDEDD